MSELARRAMDTKYDLTQFSKLASSGLFFPSVGEFLNSNSFKVTICCKIAVIYDII